MSIELINPIEFDYITGKCREFFKSRGLIECFVQNKLSILAACEDVSTISTFEFGNFRWPMIQTGQMSLEDILLVNPTAKGYFCITTSYRDEPTPIPGRHDKIFPMIEFEIPVGAESLREFEKDLLEYLGFGPKNTFPEGNYLDICQKYDTTELIHEHEKRIYEDFGPVFFLNNFPESTSPFWNMDRLTSGLAKKTDVIIYGIETIGSAERSCDPDTMRQKFYSISDGMYADVLFSRFGQKRVENELDAFLSHKFFTRSGAGIGFTRLARAMKIAGLIPPQ
jgi:aspartyl/asparaginyl-tRNA synthetase